MGPENWLVGCVQLWFSMAITKTVLIEGPSSARAFPWIERASRANRPSVPKRVTCDIITSQCRDAGQRWLSTRLRGRTEIGIKFYDRFVKFIVITGACPCSKSENYR